MSKGGRRASSGGKATRDFGEEDDDQINLPHRAPRPSKAPGKGKAVAAAVPPAQEGPLPQEPQEAVSALALAAAASAASAGAAAVDAEDDEPGVLPADLLAVSRRVVKRMHRSLEITYVDFGIYDKSQVRTPLEYAVLIFHDLSLADAGKLMQLKANLPS